MAAPVLVPPVFGAEPAVGRRPYSGAEAVVAGAVSISIPSSRFSGAADAAAVGAAVVVGAGAAVALGGGGGGFVAAACDATDPPDGETNPSGTRIRKTPNTPINRTTPAVIAATAPVDICRDDFTGSEIGAAPLMLALTAEAEPCGACCCC